jgi:multidrug efflux system outer membrane protein
MMRIKNKMVKRFILIATFVNLVSCSLVGTDYKRPEVSVPNSYHQEVQSNNLAKDINMWWKLYQDPILNNLMDKALTKNTDINAAIARVEESDAYLREVGAALLPEVDLNSQAFRNRVTRNATIPLGTYPALRKDYLVRLGTSFELDFWGKLRRAKESAKAEFLASEYAKDTVVLTLQSLVASNYLLLRSLDSQIQFTKASVKFKEDILTLTHKRLESGLVSELDVNQAEANFDNLAAQLSDLIRQREFVLNQLVVLTGDMNLNIIESTLDGLVTPPTPPASLPSTLLESRPDVRQAEQLMIAANANIGVAKAALFPTISLTTNLGAESDALRNLNSSGSSIWGGGLGLSLPIFDAGRVRSRIEQATAREKQALNSYESSIQNAFKEVNNALVELREYTEQEKDLKLAQDAAKRAMDIASNRYKAGYSSYLEYLDAQRVYNDASINYIQTRQLRLVASVDLFKSLGGGWQSQEK